MEFLSLVFVLMIFSLNASFIFFISQLVLNNILYTTKRMFICNILVVCFFESIINIVFANIFVVLVISYIFFLVISISCYFLHEFRGNSLYFCDLFCIGTAKEVAGGYKYNIKIQFILSLILSTLFICFNYYVIFVYSNQLYLLLKNIFNLHNDKLLSINHISIILRVGIACILYIILRKICCSSKFDYSLNAGEKEGYLYNFFASFPFFYILHKKVENNYISLNGTLSNNYNFVFNDKELIDDNKPHIIVIMNESFSNINKRIKTNIEVTPFYDSLKGVVKGNLIVNTFGGGTETTEFEFLTGMTIGNYDYPIYPYNNIKQNKWTLARYFNNLDYETIAMHPYTATNYHRDKIYKMFGFKELMFYDDFKYKNTVRNYVSDTSMYQEIIDKFNQIKQKKNKVFIFGITMQNHGGYDSFDCEKIEVLDDGIEDKTSLNSYLSLLYLSDNSLKDLIKYFENENEWTIICFFGDHNANFSSKINKKYYEIIDEYTGSNVYQTPFFIYDNKSNDYRYIQKISANFLSVELLNKSKLIKNNYYQFLDKIYEKSYYMNFHKEQSRKDSIFRFINDMEKEYISYQQYFLK